MPIANSSSSVRLPIRHEGDVVTARRHARAIGERQGLVGDDLDALETVVAELAGDVVLTDGIGEVHLHAFDDGPRRGVEVVVRDDSASTPRTARAIEEAFSNGLPSSARRRVDSFGVTSDASGTVTALKIWAKLG
jgi:hypothetical protein